MRQSRCEISVNSKTLLQNLLTHYWKNWKIQSWGWKRKGKPNGWYWSRLFCNAFLGKIRTRETKHTEPYPAVCQLGVGRRSLRRRSHIVRSALTLFDAYQHHGQSDATLLGWVKGMILMLPFFKHLLCDRHITKCAKCFTNIPLYVTRNLCR